MLSMVNKLDAIGMTNLQAEQLFRQMQQRVVVPKPGYRAGNWEGGAK